MKLNILDGVFFLLAVSGLILLAMVMGSNNCNVGGFDLYLMLGPIVGMIAIYFWQVGKRTIKK